jgi:hypothetical protein
VRAVWLSVVRGKHFGVYGSGISFIETKSLYQLGGGGH